MSTQIIIWSVQFAPTAPTKLQNLQRHRIACNKQLDKALERARNLELPNHDNVYQPHPDETPHDGLQHNGSIEKTAFRRRIKQREWFIRRYTDSLAVLQEYNKGCPTLSTEERGSTKIWTDFTDSLLSWR